MLSVHGVNSPRQVQSAAHRPRPNPLALLLCSVVHSVHHSPVCSWPENFTAVLLHNYLQ